MQIVQHIVLLIAAADAAFRDRLGGMLEIKPTRLARLANSVYGSEHLLLFSSGSEPDKILPLLLSYEQGMTMEDDLSGRSRSILDSAGLIGKLLFRQPFFESAAGKQLAPWEISNVAYTSDSLASALLAHVRKCELLPVSCILGARYTERGAVGMRDMGAQTPAAPSSVRLSTQLPATLRCDARKANAIPVHLPLSGVADAVILSRAATKEGKSLPILVSQTLWESLAIVQARLPEMTDSQRL